MTSVEDRDSRDSVRRHVTARFITPNMHSKGRSRVTGGTQAAATTLTCFTLKPDFALVSMNMTFSSFAFFSPSSDVTCRLSCRSVLLPTSMMITSFPRSVLTSSIHLDVW